MIHSGFASLASTPLTRRELLLVISMTVLFTLIIQFDFARTSADGTRSIMGHAPWSIGSSTGEGGSRSGYKHDQLSLDGMDAEGVVEEISKSDAFLGKLVGVNELGSHGSVGRWREMTMNDSLVRWDDEAGAPRTEIIAHAPGQFRSHHVLITTSVQSVNSVLATNGRNLVNSLRSQDGRSSETSTCSTGRGIS